MPSRKGTASGRRASGGQRPGSVRLATENGLNGVGGAAMPSLAGQPGGVASSPTAIPRGDLQREQQMQQIYSHQLQIVRMAQQKQRQIFPLAELVRTGFMLLAASFAMYIVFTDYGWVMTSLLAGVLYLSGMFRFFSVIMQYFFRRVNSDTYNDALRRADIMHEPITQKATVSGDNETLSYGCSSMQGWRRSMEDAHTIVTFEDGGFFGVYDGHSGSGTSKFCGDHLYEFITATNAFRERRYPDALYDGFIAIDRHLHSHPGSDRSGCTAVVLFVKGDELFCANAGDSRCVICRDGEPFPLSTDHKPFLASEQIRIERAGGYVINRRVNGILALSRAIGDFSFKQNSQLMWDQQAVTSAPEVRSTRLNRDKDEFAIIACDGIWDVMKNEQVMDFVRPRVQQRIPLGVICEELMEACLAPQPFGLGCDNMSVIIVQFKRTPQGLVISSSGNATATATEARGESSATAAGHTSVAAAGPPLGPFSGSPAGSSGGATAGAQDASPTPTLTSPSLSPAGALNKESGPNKADGGARDGAAKVEGASASSLPPSPGKSPSASPYVAAAAAVDGAGAGKPPGALSRGSPEAAVSPLVGRTPQEGSPAMNHPLDPLHPDELAAAESRHQGNGNGHGKSSSRHRDGRSGGKKKSPVVAFLATDSEAPPDVGRPSSPTRSDDSEATSQSDRSSRSKGLGSPQSQPAANPAPESPAGRSASPLSELDQLKNAVSRGLQ